MSTCKLVSPAYVHCLPFLAKLGCRQVSRVDEEVILLLDDGESIVLLLTEPSTHTNPTESLISILREPWLISVEQVSPAPNLNRPHNCHSNRDGHFLRSL